MRKRRSMLCVALSLIAAGVVCGAGTRYDQYTEKYKNPPSPAEPQAVGYIGGSGDEYLSGGAFLTDGSALLAGTCVGPVFDPPGIHVSVIGKDGSAPATPVVQSKDKKGRDRLDTPDCLFVDGAGFLVKLAPGFKTVTGAVRFPWGSGSLTDVLTDSRNGIYVAGTCGPNFGNLAASTKTETGIAGSGAIFFGKLKGDLSGFEWCRQLMDEPQYAPRLALVGEETISLVGAYGYHFDCDGKLMKATQLPLTGKWCRGVDPCTHATASGGDGNTNTGHEPWRKPVLQIQNDKGETTDLFYAWNEKLVGLNWSRLVSDSSIRALSYDRSGHLLVVGWSDGGNTVLEYLPYDMKTGVSGRTGNRGLGFSTWGAGVGSFMHIIKIDPATGEPSAETTYCSFLGSKNAPSSVSIDFIDTAADQSVILGGGSAWGFIETGNHVNSMSREVDYMGGAFVAVLTPAMDSLRFASLIPGGGKVTLARRGDKHEVHWASRSSVVDGKTLVMVVHGASQNDKLTLTNSVQKGWGGGLLDGQYIILEMSSASAESAVATGSEDDRKKKTSKARQGQAVPVGRFDVSAGMVKDWAVIEMRDATDTLWPAFYLAAPKGTGHMDTRAGSGSFTIFGSGKDAQLLGGTRQEKRIGGQYLHQVKFKDAKGLEREANALPDCEVQVTATSLSAGRAVISYNGKSVEVDVQLQVRASTPTMKDANSIDIFGECETTFEALGFSAHEGKLTVSFYTPGR